MKTINKILSYSIILLILILIGKGIFFSSKQSKARIQKTEPKYNLTLSLENVQEYYPEADSITLIDVNMYEIFRKGSHIGVIVNTSPLSDEIYGYNSTTPLNVYLDENGNIMKVEICENRESRGYLNKVLNSGYLDLWNGLTPKEAASHNVDAVSGCTFTSVAIAQSLQARMQDLSKEKGIRSLDWKLLARQICVLIVTILAAICFFVPKKTKTLRTVTLLLSIATLGFWTNSLLSLALFYNWITNGISLAIQLPILIIAILAILFPLFTKKSFYCQYLCPFGAVQEFAGMILPVRQSATDKTRQTFFSKANIFKVFAVVRKIILLALLTTAALGVGLDLSEAEPFPIFNYQSIGFGVAIFAGVIIVVSVFIKKPWCNYLCPTGTLLEAFRGLRK